MRAHDRFVRWRRQEATPKVRWRRQEAAPKVRWRRQEATPKVRWRAQEATPKRSRRRFWGGSMRARGERCTNVGSVAVQGAGVRHATRGGVPACAPPLRRTWACRDSSGTRRSHRACTSSSGRSAASCSCADRPCLGPRWSWRDVAQRWPVEPAVRSAAAPAAPCVEGRAQGPPGCRLANSPATHGGNRVDSASCRRQEKKAPGRRAAPPAGECRATHVIDDVEVIAADRVLPSHVLQRPRAFVVP